MANNVHEGRNVKRFREMMGLKQDALAWKLGDDWNQQRISLLEQKETVEPALLQQISSVLKIPVEAFQNFDEEQAVNVISNTFTSNDTSTLNAVNPNCTFNINPVEKWLEAMEANKQLYERLIQDRDVTIGLLEKLIMSQQK